MKLKPEITFFRNQHKFKKKFKVEIRERTFQDKYLNKNDFQWARIAVFKGKSNCRFPSAHAHLEFVYRIRIEQQ